MLYYNHRWANKEVAKHLRYGQEYKSGALHADVMDGLLFKEFQRDIGHI
jgi:hypothetical protein